jgi:hypothetical protein
MMSDAFEVTARLKGALGETLLTEHKAAVQEYFREWCLEDLETHSPDWIPEVDHRTRFDIERTPHSYDVCIDGDYATWYPDCFYVLQFEPTTDRHRTFEPYRVEYPVEVKTGASSELSDNQRAVMATIEQQDNRIVPLRVRVDITALPEQFSVTPHRVRHTGDTPIPTYTTEDAAPGPPFEPEGTDSTTLATFNSDDTDDESSHPP